MLRDGSAFVLLQIVQLLTSLNKLFGHAVDVVGYQLSGLQP